MYIIYVMFRYIVLFCIKELILDNGRCPYKEWFDSLDRQVQLRVDSRLSRFEDGNFGDYRSLKDNLFEARLFFGSGYRFYFGKIDHNTILLLCGGDKSSQKKDIKKARKFLSKFLEEKNANEKS